MSGVDHDLIEEIRDSARDFLQRRDQRQRKRAEAPADRDYWREIAGVGWLGMSVPETLGGLGLGWRAMAAVLEEAGRAQLPEPLVGAGVLPAALLARIAPVDAARRDALLHAVCGGETLVGLAWQETEGQLEAGEAATAFGVSVIEREGAYVLNGEKRHVVPGAGVDGWLVTADGERGTALFFVAAGTPGVTAQVHARADGAAACHLAIESAVVPADALLARDGVLDAVDEALDLGRLMQSAELVGVARQVLADSVAYLNTRQQFGRPLASFQALQHRLVDAAMQVELAANSLLDALDTLAAQPDDATLRKTLASRAKARAARAGLEAARLAIQLHGAIGYTEECDVSLYFRSALHLAAWLGNAAAHRQRYGALAALPVPGADDDDATPITDFPREADWNGMPEADFRRLVRGFFRAHYPEHLRHAPWRLHWDEIKDWYFTLSRQGWIAPSWPREHGGMALSPARQIAFIEEAERHGVARAPDQGLVMLGPILIRHGTEEQRARFLPGILSGEAVWAQGYSEPNAGSDLASLRCEALVDGDDLIVSGQKTWSTLAQDATHMFMLVRTDKTVKKQAGISFLLVDLASTGVSRRPIRTLSGHEEFCE
uniref:acyl-CoA dehydrogenase n=1 Tax=Alcaligenes xylosoxydans xylosoxydans TaxID=85698 RepID=UPI0006693A5E